MKKQKWKERILGLAALVMATVESRGEREGGWNSVGKEQRQKLKKQAGSIKSNKKKRERNGNLVSSMENKAEKLNYNENREDRKGEGRHKEWTLINGQKYELKKKENLNGT